MESLHQSLESRLAGARRSLGFLARLTDEQRAELLEVRRRFVAGEYGRQSASAMARALVAECEVRGIPICGVQGIRAWLAQRD